jgi:hypothetical protein
VSNSAFGVLWVACAGLAFTVGLRRFRRHGTIRRVDRNRVRPDVATMASRIELAMWLVFFLGGVVFLVVALAR